MDRLDKAANTCIYILLSWRGILALGLCSLGSWCITVSPAEYMGSALEIVLSACYCRPGIYWGQSRLAVS